jgi:galactose mutarotase-like enzyme
LSVCAHLAASATTRPSANPTTSRSPIQHIAVMSCGICWRAMGAPWASMRISVPPQKPAAVGARIADVQGGYDHNFVLRREEGKLFLAARLYEPKSGRVMEIFTDQPGLQFYAGNFLDGSIKGKYRIAYGRNWGLCLETQKFPDSPNHPDWPPATSPILKPGETYHHTMVHRFSTK